ncbi:fibrillin-1-like [Microplitis mediator]|uniref:fibrillin-1-like n=1 Tax=Microplitis mediator TaxID=375433 RepID=UPI0025523A5C|nr:fibrillin-1-like [Microplitis mediator]
MGTINHFSITTYVIVLLTIMIAIKSSNERKLGKDCEKFDHCKSILNAKCSENNTCVCKNNAVEWNETVCLENNIIFNKSYEFITHYTCNSTNCSLKTDYTSQTGKQRVSKLMYGEICTNNNVCKKYGLKSIDCVDGECKCNNNKQFVKLKLGCENSEKGLGKKCSPVQTCKAKDSKCNDFNVCRCKKYRYYGTRDKCEKDPSFKCSIKSYFDAISKTCLPYTTKINGNCTEEESCGNLRHTECKNNQCQCTDKYFEKNSKCVPGIDAACSEGEICQVKFSVCTSKKICRCQDNYTAVGVDRCLEKSTYGNKCNHQNQCTWGRTKNITLEDKYVDLECIKNQCQCPEKTTFDSSLILCEKNLGQIGENCKTDENCDMRNDLICQIDKCMCKSSSFSKDGVCVLKIGEKCSATKKCRIENSQCTNTRCECKKNFYSTTIKTMCLNKAERPGDFCDNNYGCDNVRYTECGKDRTCVCRETYWLQNGSCRGLPGTNCTSHSECIANSSCNNGTCQCDGHYEGTTKECHKLVKNIDDSCTDHDDCKKIPFTQCVDKKCQCLPNFERKGNVCKGLPGANCTADSNCLENSSYIDDSCTDHDDCKKIPFTQCVDEKCQCLPNFERKGDVCKGLPGANCTADSNCLENSSCNKGTCRCDDHYEETTKECHKLVKNIDDSCTDHDDCKKIPFTQCVDEKCQCLPNFERKGDVCKGLPGANCTADSNCLENSSYIDDSCTDHDDCKKIPFTQCVDEKCQCLPNFEQKGDVCKGLPGAHCTADSNCLENSSCNKGTCRCDDHYEETTKECHKLVKNIDDSCTDHDDCKKIPFTQCVDEKCQCLPNFERKGDVCKGLPGANCTADSNCLENSSCNKGTCRCDDHYEETTKECHKLVKNIDDSCTDHDDCKKIPFTQCVDEKCQCLPNFERKGDVCKGLPGANCTADSNCLENSSCNKGTCRCDDHYEETTKECHKLVKNIDDSCTDHDDCKKIPFTQCVDEKCQCLPNFERKGDVCKGLPGANCTADSNCLENSSCNKGTCRCDDHYEETTKECHKLVKNIDDSCTDHDDCKKIPFTQCVDEKCQCLPNFERKGDVCKGLPGANCTADSNCLENSSCNEGTCRCDDHYEETTKECHKLVKNIDDSCTDHDDCKKIPFTQCVDEKCQCLPNFERKGDVCKGLPGANCTADSNCLENSSCNKGTCRCDDHYEETTKECHKLVKNIDDSCTDHDDCKKIPFTQCVDEKCQCLPNFERKGDVCKGLPGTNCTADSNCLENSSCNKGTCRCDNHYEETTKECHKLVKNIDDSCTDHDDCKKIPFTQCVDEKCRCLPNFERKGDVCKGLPGTNCTADSNCLENSSCNKGTCRCDDHYEETTKECHKLVKNIDDSCTDHDDCKKIPFTQCVDEKCQCLPNFERKGDVCKGLPGANCTADSNCLENSSCNKGTCRCDDHYEETTKECHKLVKNIDDSCTDHDDCKKIPFTQCVDEKCQCLPNFERKGDVCKGLPGANCTADSNCLENSSCNKGTCRCDDHYEETTKECHKLVKNIDDSCTDHDDCKKIPFTQCVDEKCQCLPNFERKGDVCKGLPGANCTADPNCLENSSYIDDSCTDHDDCKKIPFTQCVDEKCQCLPNFERKGDVCKGLPGANCTADSNCLENSSCNKGTCRCDDHYEETTKECHKLVKNIDDSCTDHDDCKKIPFTQCVDEKCQCLPNFERKGDVCKGLPGANCTADSNCLENSSCNKGTCRCDDHYEETTKECHKLVKNIDDSCTDHDDCKKIPFTQCVDEKCQCLPNFERKGDVCKGLPGTNCTADSNCLENSSCNKGTCRCDDHYEETTKECHKLVKNIDDSCTDHDDCKKIPFTQCVDEKCQCLPNFERKGDVCKGLPGTNCTADSNCLENSSCNKGTCRCDDHYEETTKECHKLVKNIDDSCTDHDDCKKIPFTQCVDEKCQCLPNFERKGDVCKGLPGANCTADSNCLENSSCNKGTCRCDDHYEETTKECHKLVKNIDDSCTDHDDCKKIPFTQCVDEKCQCLPNFERKGDVCKGLPGTNCTADSNCLENSSCNKGTCRCDDHYEETTKECHKLVKNIDDSCTDHDDCKKIPFTQCVDEKCQCLPNFERKGDVCKGLPGANCTADSNCLENSSCNKGTCRCDDHYEETTKECHKLVKNIDDSCTDHDDCKKIPFTQCVDEKCQCLPNFERKGDVCKGLPGTNCTADSNCLENSSCNKGTCRCDDHYEETTKECHKLVKNIDDSCTDHDDCKKIPFTQCVDEKCQCLPNFERKGDVCKGLPGANCTADSNCLENSSCNKGTCRCDDHYEETTKECHKLVKNIDDSCTDHDDCKKIPFTQCVDEKCQCLPNFERKGDVCKGLPGTNCTADSNCLENSSCNKGTCRCDDHYEETTKECHKLVKNIDDSCTDHDDCKKIPFTQCVDEKCQCLPNFKRKGDVCKGLPGANCTADSNCLENSSCNKGTCRCDDHYEETTKECHKLVKTS